MCVPLCGVDRGDFAVVHRHRARAEMRVRSRILADILRGLKRGGFSRVFRVFSVCTAPSPRILREKRKFLWAVAASRRASSELTRMRGFPSRRRVPSSIFGMAKPMTSCAQGMVEAEHVGLATVRDLGDWASKIDQLAARAAGALRQPLQVDRQRHDAWCSTFSRCWSAGRAATIRVPGGNSAACASLRSRSPCDGPRRGRAPARSLRPDESMPLKALEP